MRISTEHVDSFFFSRSNALIELRNLAKIKDTTETVCQRNSPETAQQNFLKLCCNEGHNVYICKSTVNFNSIFVLELRTFELWPK